MPGSRPPFISRDFAAELQCKTTDCPFYSHGSQCACPASVIIENGKCKLYAEHLEQKKQSRL